MSVARRCISSRRTLAGQNGFSLIEVLVSTLVLTVGILGVAAMQMMSFQTNQSAYMRSQAVYLAQDMLDRIRANPDGYRNTTVYNAVDTDNGSTIPGSPNCIATPAGCSPTQMAQQDLREWSQNFVNTLNVADFRPRLLNGRGIVERVTAGGNDFTVTVSWDDRDYDDAGNLTRDKVTRQVSFTATLN